MSWKDSLNSANYGLICKRYGVDCSGHAVSNSTFFLTVEFNRHDIIICFILFLCCNNIFKAPIRLAYCGDSCVTLSSKESLHETLPYSSLRVAIFDVKCSRLKRTSESLRSVWIACVTVIILVLIVSAQPIES